LVVFGCTLQPQPKKEAMLSIRKIVNKSIEDGMVGVVTSVPIPMHLEGQVRVAFFRYGVAERGPFAGTIYSPHQTVYVDPWTGAVTMRADWPPEVALGKDTSTLAPSVYLGVREALYNAYDVLLPAFATSPRSETPEVKQAAATFAREYRKLPNKLLEPSVRKLGGEFFGWVDHLAATP
jgi:hypothetical protein